MGDRLIVRVPWHQAVFDRWDADHKNNNRKDNARQSFADELGYLGACCSGFLDRALASVNLPQTLPPKS